MKGSTKDASNTWIDEFIDGELNGYQNIVEDIP